MTRSIIPLLLPAVLAASARGQVPSDAAGLELAAFEDYRTSVGSVQDGVLHVSLEARAAAWRPWGEGGPVLRAHVFAAEGQPPRTPGPLIRTRVGTPVHVSVHNTFDRTLIVRGLRDRGALSPQGPIFTALTGDSLLLEAGAMGKVYFTPTVPGTYVWFGRTLLPGESANVPTVFPVRGEDRAFWGVLIVDPPDAPAELPAERIFLITHWGSNALPASFLPATRFFVNGRSWPHTERLYYEQGDTVRWRVINVTGRSHPMHLHGAYFSVDARGDQLRERVIPTELRHLAVTEVLDVAQTMRISWIAHEPGNWLFHCHFMRHMSPLQTRPLDATAVHEHPPGDDEEMMGGLVLGITVRPGSGRAHATDPPRRRFDLHITRRDAVFGDEPGYAFVLQDGSPPAADSLRFPGSMLVLRRGEPTQIVVHNRADVPLGVHWHGLELESWADGVPGWSGGPERTVPAIPPGDSLAVRMTPPRAGTFMYHVHSEPGHQLAQGLYGPFLVLDGAGRHDPDTDRVFLLGSLGSGDDPPPAINGLHALPPLQLRAGTTYRLRFMHISPDDDKRVSLLAGDSGQVAWRVIAKDGADLPPALVRDVQASQRIDVGETYDFLWTPVEGEYTLRVITTFDRGVAGFPRSAPDPHTADVRITVRSPG